MKSVTHSRPARRVPRRGFRRRRPGRRAAARYSGRATSSTSARAGRTRIRPAPSRPRTPIAPGASACVTTLSKTIKGTLTIIAHDSVTDWLNGGADEPRADR